MTYTIDLKTLADPISDRSEDLFHRAIAIIGKLFRTTVQPYNHKVFDDDLNRQNFLKGA